MKRLIVCMTSAVTLGFSILGFATAAQAQFFYSHPYTNITSEPAASQQVNSGKQKAAVRNDRRTTLESRRSQFAFPRQERTNPSTHGQGRLGN